MTDSQEHSPSVESGDLDLSQSQPCADGSLPVLTETPHSGGYCDLGGDCVCFFNHEICDYWRSSEADAARAGWSERDEQGDTTWTRSTDEKPVCDGLGERYLLTWCTRTATYDIGCIDSNWSPGETIETAEGELWRWLDVNPERHLPAESQPIGLERSDVPAPATDALKILQHDDGEGKP